MKTRVLTSRLWPIPRSVLKVVTKTTTCAFVCVLANSALGTAIVSLSYAKTDALLNSPVLSYSPIFIVVVSPIIESISFALFVDLACSVARLGTSAIATAFLFSALHAVNGVNWSAQVLPLFLMTGYLYAKQRGLGLGPALFSICYLHILHNLMCSWLTDPIYVRISKESITL
jgi:hypothetical protein